MPNEVDYSTLAQVLTWIVSGPGAGVLAFWALGKWAWFAERTAEHKRYLSWASTALLAMAAFSGAVGLGYTPSPADVQTWAEALFAVAFLACGFSQTLHGRTLRD